MSSLEFMQRHIKWQLCGGQIRECCVGTGSTLAHHDREELPLHSTSLHGLGVLAGEQR
jgi:hypothetical protein